MLQLHNLKPSPLSLKRILFSGLSGGIGIIGIVFAGAVYVVESLTRPKKPTPFDNYTFSPYELGLPAEAVVFPPLQGDHKISGWYIPFPAATTTIPVCPRYCSRLAEALWIRAP